jgi:hypothetical protein
MAFYTRSSFFEGNSEMQRVARRALAAAMAATAITTGLVTVSDAHHSFAMYDQSKRLTLTGKLIRYTPAPNHAQFLFELLEVDGTPVLDENGEPVLWGAETGPSTRIARQGVTHENFPEGSIITIEVNPLRDGRNFGAVPNGTPLINCGLEMPAGGCTAETGKAYLTENY